MTLLTSGELARLAGVSTDTLRHYERKGVLNRPRRKTNGYREYTSQSLGQVKLVRSALSIGFTLDELARILKERAGGRAPCRQVRDLAARKLAALERQIKEMRSLREHLRETLRNWDVKLARTPEGASAGLLESLSAPKERKIGGVVPPAHKTKKRRTDFL